MKVLLTGRTGQVGWRLERALPAIAEVIALDRDALDLTQVAAIRRVIRETRPDVIVNAAGYTHVDHVESDAHIAHAVNGVAPVVMAEEALASGALFIHYSSGYVFDGRKSEPYTETDVPAPINEYGRSKLFAERGITEIGGAHLILRASWVYDTRARNFVLTMLRLAATHTELNVVDDQMGSPTSASAIAAATCAVVRDLERARRNPGIYNLSAPDSVSRYDFTRYMLDTSASMCPTFAAPRLNRIKTADFPLPAARPLNCMLDNTKLMNTFDIPLTGWAQQLRECLAELYPPTLRPDDHCALAPRESLV